VHLYFLVYIYIYILFDHTSIKELNIAIERAIMRPDVDHGGPIRLHLQDFSRERVAESVQFQQHLFLTRA
jgi:hypothetical protein